MDIRVAHRAARLFLALQGRLLEPTGERDIESAASRLAELFQGSTRIGPSPNEPGVMVYRAKSADDLPDHRCLELLVSGEGNDQLLIERVRAVG